MDVVLLIREMHGNDPLVRIRKKVSKPRSYDSEFLRGD